MRVQLRRIAVLLVVLLLGSGTALVARHLWRQREADLGQAFVEVLPNVAQRIQNFHRVKVDGDRKVWEIAAREAQYDDVHRVATVEEPLVSFYFKDGSALGLRGRRGRISMDERELRDVEVSGDIRVEIGAYSVTTESARYDHAEEAIVAPSPVRIVGGELEIEGNSMRIDLAARTLKLAGKVRTTLRPGA